MISKDYFLYLIKSKKGLLILEGILVLLLLLAAPSYESWLFLGLSAVMSYFLSLNVFSYVHSKKAVDTYFSLPVSRKAMLCTGILFATVFSSLPSLFGILFKNLLTMGLYSGLLVFFFAGIVMNMIIVMFNVSLYLLGNNNVDGIIIVSSYTLLPAFIYLAAYSFLEVFVAGYDGSSLDFVQYLSPTYIYIASYVDLVEQPYYLGETINYLPIAICFICFAILSVFVLKKEYINRKVERAESISKNLFAYPMIIAVYMSLGMFGISTGFEGNFVDFFIDYFVLYVVLFAAFVAAMFLFRRKMEFNWKLPVIYIGVMILTLGFATVARSTRGFGLSYAYVPQTSDTCYELYYYSPEAEYIDEYAREITGEEGKLYYAGFTVENSKANTKSFKKETLELMQKKQMESIERYYNYDYGNSGSISIKRGCHKNGSVISYSSYHYYYRTPSLTEEEFRILTSDPAVEFEFEFTNGSYYGDKYIDEPVTY